MFATWIASPFTFSAASYVDLARLASDIALTIFSWNAVITARHVEVLDVPIKDAFWHTFWKVKSSFI
jgi:hypothetical protein